MKTTRRKFFLTTAGGSLGALDSGCASPDSAAQPSTVAVDFNQGELVFETTAAKKQHSASRRSQTDTENLPFHCALPLGAPSLLRSVP